MKIKFLDNEIKCLLTKNQSEKLLFEVLRHYGDMITIFGCGNVAVHIINNALCMLKLWKNIWSVSNVISNALVHFF